MLYYTQEILDSEAEEYCIALIFIAVEENKEQIQSILALSFIYGNEIQKVTFPNLLSRVW